MLDAVTTVQVNRYNYETIELLHRSIADSSQELVAAGEPPLELYVVEVSFDKLADNDERRSFSGMPTTFDLGDDEIDHLRAVAGRILDESPDFARLLRSLGADAAR